MRRELIDVHSHLYPECYLGRLEKRLEIPRVMRRGKERLFNIFPGEKTGGRPMDAGFWDPAAKLAWMDGHGIGRSVISLGNPWLNPLPDAVGDALAREVNLELAGLKAATGGRLVGMGALPASSPLAAADELDFIAGQDGLTGASAGPRIAGLRLDDPGLAPFWDRLARLDLPLFIHPENGLGADEVQDLSGALIFGAAFPLETTTAVCRLIFGGVLERRPGLRILLAHGGGTLPYLAGRLDAVWRADPALQAGLPKPPSDYLKMLYYDGVVYSTPAMRALAALAGPGHILFGTDHPFSIADPEGNLRAAEAEFNEAGLHLALGGTARQFFNL